MSSNIGQNYPYGRETEAQRATTMEKAFGAFDGLRERVAAEATPLPDTGRDAAWWTWVCPADGAVGRLHVAGHARDRHAVYTFCDTCGRTFLR